MNGRHPRSSLLGFETFGTAVGLAVVAGALSLIAPSLTVLVGTLAALALAGWASLRYQEGGRGRRIRWKARGLALAVLGLGGIVYLDPPGSLASVRALLLGLGLVPLWAAERRTPDLPSAGGTDR